MDDLGNYIYLFFLLVAAVISLVGKQRKASGKKERPEVQSDKTWEERMQDLRDTVSSEAAPPPFEEDGMPPVFVMEETDEEEPLAAQPVVAEAAVEPVQPDEQPLAVTVQKQVAKPEQAAVVTEEAPADEPWVLATPDDARRAFVYGEIFNRKY